METQNNNESRLLSEVESLRRIIKLLCLSQKDKQFKINIKTFRSKKDDIYKLVIQAKDSYTVIAAENIKKVRSIETKQI